MLTVTMVGAAFRPAAAKDIIKRMHIGDTVELRADPDNAYDTTAVAVYSDDTHIGFVPKESNSHLFSLLTNGEEVTAEVIAFENTLKPVLEITFGGTVFNDDSDEPTDADLGTNWGDDD